MILQTSIYNNNYYPIFLYRMNHSVLDIPHDYKGNTYVTKNALIYTDATSLHLNKSTMFDIYGCTFDNKNGIIIKPFQTQQYFTEIDLSQNVSSFQGTIRYDSTLYTDAYNYSAFGILSD